MVCLRGCSFILGRIPRGRCSRIRISDAWCAVCLYWLGCFGNSVEAEPEWWKVIAVTSFFDVVLLAELMVRHDATFVWTRHRHNCHARHLDTSVHQAALS